MWINRKSKKCPVSDRGPLTTLYGQQQNEAADAGSAFSSLTEWTLPPMSRHEHIRSALTQAHAALASGDPHTALSLVLSAVQLLGAAPTAFPALQHALDVSGQEGSSSGGAGVNIDQLTNLLSQISIQAEQQSAQGPSSSAGGVPGLAPSHLAAAGARHAASPQYIHTASSPAAPSQPWGAAAGYSMQHEPCAEAGDVCMNDSGPSSLHGQQQQQQQHEQLVVLEPATLLDESGRGALADCALADGSSYVCPRCRGVVQRSRAAQHEQFWCQP